RCADAYDAIAQVRVELDELRRRRPPPPAERTERPPPIEGPTPRAEGPARPAEGPTPGTEAPDQGSSGPVDAQRLSEALARLREAVPPVPPQATEPAGRPSRPWLPRVVRR